MPVSMTAITIELEPVVTSQARAASMSAPAVPYWPATDWPVFRSPHWYANDGSLGTWSARTR